jgi:GNAT superfamily N-acetyltransferase
LRPAFIVAAYFHLMSKQDSHLPRGFEAKRIDGDPESLALLARAYEQVYLPAFPLEYERETLEDFSTGMTDPDPASRYTISVIGSHLGDPRRERIAGFAAGKYYPGFEVGLLAYIATAPEARNKGIGRAVLNQTFLDLDHLAGKLGKQLHGIFLESNDPAKISAAEDSMDPQLRIDIYKRWGGLITPIDYVHPPLAEGMEKCDTMKLMMFPHPVHGGYPEPKDLQRFIDAAYTVLGADLKTDPDYARITKQIQTWERKQAVDKLLSGSGEQPPAAALDKRPDNDRPARRAG